MDLLFFDCETCGLPKDYKAPVEALDNWPRIVSLAWLAYEDEKLVSEVCYITKPFGWTIPAEAIKVHNITNEMANDEGVEIERICEAFRKRAQLSDLLVAHNYSFDSRVVAAELLRCGHSGILQNIPWICTMHASTNFVGIPNKWGGCKWPKLSELYEKLFETQFSGAHDALADVRATAKCFFELQKRGVINIKELLQ